MQGEHQINQFDDSIYEGGGEGGGSGGEWEKNLLI
jgi:hypothetical protein